jgi:hypothetical protein
VFFVCWTRRAENTFAHMVLIFGVLMLLLANFGAATGCLSTFYVVLFV